jgi:adenosine kinase
MKIYISGSLAYDRIMGFPGKFADHILPDKLHILNVCFLVGGLNEKFGGTAGNIAFNLAMLDEKPIILSTCGHDFKRYREWIEENGLSLEGIREIDGVPTAGAYITTDKSDNQITAFNPGAMAHQAKYAFNHHDTDDVLAIIAPGNLDDMREFAQAYKDLKIPYIFDPGQNIPAFKGYELEEMIKGSRLLISNDYELELIQKSTGLTNGELLKKTEAIITTLGEHGSVVRTNSGETKIRAAHPDQVVDPTGAGDAFRAGLIKGLVLGRNLAEAAMIGSTCASFAVEKHGTQEHRFTTSVFRQRHQACFGWSALKDGNTTTAAVH